MKQSTIATSELNFRVRNENGCDPAVKPPEQKTQNYKIQTNRVCLYFSSQAHKPQIIAILKFLSLFRGKKHSIN